MNGDGGDERPRFESSGVPWDRPMSTSGLK